MEKKKPIWLIWVADIGPEKIIYSLRAVCTSKSRSELYKKMLENQERDSEKRRVVSIEKNLTNHLYGEMCLRVARIGPRGNVPYKKEEL